jgi:uncharacterized protein involved in response to NO
LGGIVVPQSPVNGAIVLIAAAIQGARSAQQHGHRTWRHPRIWVLHAGYGWLVIALLLKGVWLIAGADPRKSREEVFDHAVGASDSPRRAVASS